MKKYLIVLLSIALAACSSNSKVGKTQASDTILTIPDSLYPSADLSIPTHNEWTSKNYPKMIKSFKANPLQLHDIVFAGNSITSQGRNWGERLNNKAIKNRGIAGDVTDGLIARLGEINYIKPTAVFIEIGINDLLNDTLSPERTAKNIIQITKIIHQQNPKTKIFVQTIFPTNKVNQAARIKLTNDIIRKHKRKGVFTLIETHILFAGKDDLMQKELSTDGIHLNEKGYQIWVDCLKKYFE
ncbi:GDSL-type esterase/lipase family protein [Flavobacterium sp. HJJ]|uniref:GDSL-type esterase/lipase family protein n=1 Tax=Flavobacterium sp. HJJ TaxID=2783792 RepID=UPI00188A7B55|nr:GDSL-type esterase/lipase family protein [Flavobacterium sp. HJJ]MBF4471411.1 GDSL family lipase [Flavobacterium sp. HJJ]